MKLSVLSLVIATAALTATSLSYAEAPESIRQAHYQRCAKPVFYAQTANHKKEVEICLVTPSVSYSFGKVNVEKKEMDIVVPARNTSFITQSNQIIAIEEFTVRNGDTYYQVAHGRNDEGRFYADLDVYKGDPATGKHLVTIKLDPETVVSNISYSLADEGIPVAEGF